MKKSNKIKLYKGYFKNKYFLFISAFTISIFIVIFIFIVKNELNVQTTEKKDVEDFYKSFIKNNPYDARHYMVLSDFYEKEKNELSNEIKMNGKILIQNQMLKSDRKIAKITKNHNNTGNQMHNIYNIYNTSDDSILSTNYIDIHSKNNEFIDISQSFEKKEYQDVLEIVDKYIKNGSKKNDVVFIFLADAYYMLEEYDSAFLIYKDLLEIGNTNIAYINGKLGNILYIQRNYTEAQKYYMVSIEIESNNSFVEFNAAKIFIKDGKIDDALEIFANIVDKHRNQKSDVVYHSYIESANIYLSLSEYSQAIASYLQASDIKKDYKIFQSIAMSYEMLKDKDNAKLYYKKSLKLEERADLYYNIARLKYNDGNYEKTISYIEECLNIDKSNIKAYLLLADCFIKTKKYDSALNTLEYAIENEYKHHSIYTKMALILYNNKNQPDDAMKMINKSIKTDPNIITNYTILSDICLEIGNTNKAIDSYKKAMYIDADNVNIKYELANIYYENKLYAEAGQIFEDIIRQDPGFMQIYEKLNVIQKELDKI